LIDNDGTRLIKAMSATWMHSRRVSRAVDPTLARNALFSVHRLTPQARATDDTLRAGDVWSIANAVRTTEAWSYIIDPSEPGRVGWY